jgi:hypothetical protein
MNSSKKIKSKMKSKSSRELDDVISAALARIDAATEVGLAKVLADAPAINAKLDRYFEEARREAEEAVRLLEARMREAPVTRALLVEALGMLGSANVGDQAAVARKIESLRAKLDKTWDELIVWDPDAPDEDEDDDLDDDDEEEN